MAVSALYKHMPRRNTTVPAIFAACFLLTGCMTAPVPKPLPQDVTLSLEGSRPIIDARVGGVTLRLRIDLSQWDTVELNPSAAARLGRRDWMPNHTMQIGRIAVPGRSVPVSFEVAGRKLNVLASEHGRVVADDADGVAGPDLLPYRSIEWTQPTAPAPTDTLVLPTEASPTLGLVAMIPALAVPVRLRFAPQRAMSEATAAAGSMLAQRFGGHFDGPPQSVPILFGVARPARPMRFDRPLRLAGFRFHHLLVRASDFRGDNPLPSDPVEEGDILVAAKDHPQIAESWVTLAADRLSACRSIAYDAQAHTISLSCAFDP